MAGRRSNRELTLQRRAEIAKLALFGRPTQQEIADKIGVDVATVCRHLKAIRGEWKQQAQADINEVIAQELQKLDELEAQALAEWERSKKDYQKKVAESGGRGGKKAKIETGGQCGDPRYLQVILGIQDRRAKLLGTDKPQKVAPTNPDGTEPYKPMTDAELDARILELSKKLGPEAEQANGSS